MRHLQKGLQLSFGICLVLCLALILSGCLIDLYITRSTQDRIYVDSTQVPARPIGLVLGTAKFYNNSINLYYHYRIQAAADLFKQGKVRGLIVSGDHSLETYNEPLQMQQDLIALGVPGKYIALDYAGFRTLDSVIRAQRVFNQSNVIIISQAFHCQRALWIADHTGMAAIGYAAKDIPLRWGWRVRAREVLARVVALLDVTVFHRQPHFLGSPEPVNLQPARDL